MASIALTDDPACCDVGGGKQRCGAMALVVMTAARRLTGPHGEQRLDLRLLVDTEHDGTLGRSHVEADDVANLGDEIGVG
jgi:hypothetical protein